MRTLRKYCRMTLTQNCITLTNGLYSLSLQRTKIKHKITLKGSGIWSLLLASLMVKFKSTMINWKRQFVNVARLSVKKRHLQSTMWPFKSSFMIIWNFKIKSLFTKLYAKVKEASSICSKIRLTHLSTYNSNKKFNLKRDRQVQNRKKRKKKSPSCW